MVTTPQIKNENETVETRLPTVTKAKHERGDLTQEKSTAISKKKQNYW